MGETKYFLMEVDKLIPYARNARTHSEVQIAQIAASIKEFGFLSPVIISKDNTILCGVTVNSSTPTHSPLFPLYYFKNQEVV